MAGVCQPGRRGPAPLYLATVSGGLRATGRRGRGVPVSGPGRVHQRAGGVVLRPGPADGRPDRQNGRGCQRRAGDGGRRVGSGEVVAAAGGPAAADQPRQPAAEGSRDWPQVVITPGAHPIRKQQPPWRAARPTAQPTPRDLWRGRPGALLCSLAQEPRAWRARSPGRAGGRSVRGVVHPLRERGRAGGLHLLAVAGRWPGRAASATGGGGVRAPRGLLRQCVTATGAPPLPAGWPGHGRADVGGRAPAGDRLAGRSGRPGIEPGLKELLLADLRAGYQGQELGRGDPPRTTTPGLPLLAHALRTTWQQRHGAVLTLEGTGYRPDRHAIARTASRSIRVHEGGQRASKVMFLRLVKMGDSASERRPPPGLPRLA